ncbi:hypothetical protein ACUN9Y_22180, partial [Halomonas sp. V046]|uniref:hypothetical protein n=1 Tax=Halomonas sp. V046 TaxID=3459611 RepID=UPI004043D446
YHLRFEQHGGQLTYIDGLNRALPIEPLAPGEQRFLPRERMTLAHPDGDTYELTYLDGSRERYRRMAGVDAGVDTRSDVRSDTGGDASADSRADRVHFRLVERRERDGRALTLSYRQGRLAAISDGAELELSFVYGQAGLLERVLRHYPASDHEPEVLALYAHDAKRN